MGLPPSRSKVVYALEKAIRTTPPSALLASALRSILKPLTYLSQITSFASDDHGTSLQSILNFAEDVYALLRHDNGQEEAQERLTELHVSALSLQRELDAKGFTTAFHPSHISASKIRSIMDCLNELKISQASLHSLCQVLHSLPALYAAMEYLFKLPISPTSLSLAFRYAVDSTTAIPTSSSDIFNTSSPDKLASILQRVDEYLESVDHSELTDIEKDSLRDCIQTMLETHKLTSDRIRVTTFPKQSFSLPHEIGRSSHTTVYKAVFSMCDGPVHLWTTTVALKAFHLSASSRLRHLYFYQESLRLHSFSHPCLPTLYGLNWPFSKRGRNGRITSIPDMPNAPVALVATELMTHDLQQARQEPCLRSMSVRVRLLRDLADALGYLHRSRTYHGHVTPQNILVRIHNESLYGRAKLDVTGVLGRAILTSQQKDKSIKNLLYLAPEATRSSQHYYTGDVWSFGVVACYLLLDGPHLLHNPSEEAVLTLIANQGFVENVKKWCSSISDENLRGVVSRCLAENPKERIDSQTLSQLMEIAAGRISEPKSANSDDNLSYEDIDDVVLDSSANKPACLDSSGDWDDKRKKVHKRKRDRKTDRTPRCQKRAHIVLPVNEETKGYSQVEREDDDMHCYVDGHEKVPEPNDALISEEQPHCDAFNLNNLYFDAVRLFASRNSVDCERAFKLFRRAADDGHLEAMRYCGQCLLNGWGTKENYTDGIMYLRQGAILEHGEATRLLGACYEEGMGVDIDYCEAFRLFKRSEQLGNSCANTNIGLCFEKGLGVRKNRKNAIKHYKKAAEDDDEVALNNLGVLFNQGTKKNYVLAVAYYREAIKFGSVEAQCNLGDCYMSGQGVAKDYSMAMDLYRESSEKGNLVARTEMATLYYLGLGVPADYMKAASLFRESLSVPEAVRWLGTAFYDGNGVQENLDEAIRLYRQAIEIGNVEANLNLAICYYFGRGVPRSYEHAMECYQLAAGNGCKEACLCIGNMYFSGLGVEQDMEVACKWYKEGGGLDLTYIVIK